MGRSGSREVGREQLERKRVLAAVGSLPFCPPPPPPPPPHPSPCAHLL